MEPESLQDDSHKALGKRNRLRKRMFQKFDEPEGVDEPDLLLVQNRVLKKRTDNYNRPIPQHQMGEKHSCNRIEFLPF